MVISRIPTEEEVIDEYVERMDYLSECANETCDCSGECDDCDEECDCNREEALDDCVEELREVYQWVADSIKDAFGRSIYRAYDYHDDEESIRHKIDPIVETLRNQLARGVVRRPSEREIKEYASSSDMELVSGTSWSPNEPLVPGTKCYSKDEQTIESYVFIESAFDYDQINVMDTFFVNQIYSGGSSGMEFKIKRGSVLFVKALHHYDIETGRMIVDPVGKKVRFQ